MARHLLRGQMTTKSVSVQLRLRCHAGPGQPGAASLARSPPSTPAPEQHASQQEQQASARDADSYAGLCPGAEAVIRGRRRSTCSRAPMCCMASRCWYRHSGNSIGIRRLLLTQMPPLLGARPCGALRKCTSSEHLSSVSASIAASIPRTCLRKGAKALLILRSTA